MPNLIKDSFVDGNIATNFMTQEERKRYMMSELERLKNEWDEETKVEIPEEKKYDRKEYLQVDRAGVKNDVEQSMSGEFISGVNVLKADNDKKVGEKQTDIDEEKTDISQESARIHNEYEKEREDSANDMIKRGIARSSIAQGEQERLVGAEEEDLRLAKEKSEVKIKGLELEIALLRGELQSDLSALKISHATKVQTKIDSILKKIDEENAKILEYNNEMEKREQADKKEIARLQSNALAEKYKLARNEARYGYSGAKKDNYLQRLSIARDYFSRLSKEQALAELKANEKLYDYLGLYYNRLHSEILGRRE